MNTDIDYEELNFNVPLSGVVSENSSYYKKDKDPLFLLCDVVRETAYSIHQYFRHGHLEKVYENALVHRLRKQNIKVLQQAPINVFDFDGTPVGNYVADMIIDDSIIIELKACNCLNDEHVAQVLGYLRASKIDHGLLLNFGSPKFQIKKLIFDRV